MLCFNSPIYVIHANLSLLLLLEAYFQSVRNFENYNTVSGSFSVNVVLLKKMPKLRGLIKESSMRVRLYQGSTCSVLFNILTKLQPT